LIFVAAAKENFVPFVHDLYVIRFYSYIFLLDVGGSERQCKTDTLCVGDNILCTAYRETVIIIMQIVCFFLLHFFLNPLSAKWRAWTTWKHMSESETTSEWNWKETRAHIKSLSLWTQYLGTKGLSAKLTLLGRN